MTKQEPTILGINSAGKRAIEIHLAKSFTMSCIIITGLVGIFLFPVWIMTAGLIYAYIKKWWLSVMGD